LRKTRALDISEELQLLGSNARSPSRLAAPAAIVTLVVLAMSTCVIGLVAWKAVEARTAALTQNERDIRNLAHSLAEHASHTVLAADVAMSAIVDLLKYQRPRSDRFELFLRNTVEALPQLREIGVLNSEGYWTYSSLADTPQYSNADRPYFVYHRDTVDPKLRISEPFKSRLTGRATILLSKRISNPDGSFGGALVAGIDSEYFTNFYKAFNLGPHAGITLIRSDGIVLTRWPLLESAQDFSKLETFRTEIIQGTAGYYRLRSPFDGLLKSFGYEHASQYPLILTVARPEDEVLAGWEAGLRSDLMVAALLMCSVFLLAILLSAQLRARSSMERVLKELNARLAELATTDGLTGLANRRTFDAAMRREFNNCDRISVMLMDIDNFKGFNDSLGHQAGDECLKRVAQVIADATSNTSALSARYGGEEFAIILPGVSEQGALKVAEAIRLTTRSLAIANPAASRGFLSISFGIASKTPDTADQAMLVGDADLALYEAKRLGRNCSVVNSSLKPRSGVAAELLAV
jgi:diguanylate cyclase (GGDEF)-like protein